KASREVEGTGRVNRAQFHRYLQRSDIVVNLRYPSAGEMSATLLRALAYGKPVLMSRLPHLLEIPPKAAGRIRPDHEQDDLFHHLWQLVERKSLREKSGEAALAYMKSHHRPEQMLERYTELIETALQRKASFRTPDMPLHLRDGREIMRDYIRRTAFGGNNSVLLDWILP
ncbi:MAG TPA: glycosyltransferase, partial [Acidobacteriota bacterium]|nr:glycosyltransferase [Acidobacteriota bacterium]